MQVKPADILVFLQAQRRQTAQARRLAQFDTDAAALRCGEVSSSFYYITMGIGQIA